MKITSRLILYLVLVAAVVTGAFSYLQFENEKLRLADQLEKNASLISEALRAPLETALEDGRIESLRRLVRLPEKHGRLLALAVYGVGGVPLAESPGTHGGLDRWMPAVQRCIAQNRTLDSFERAGGKRYYFHATPLVRQDKPAAALVQLRRADLVGEGTRALVVQNFMHFLILSALMTLTILLVMWWSVTKPLNEIAQWLRRLRLGEMRHALTLPRGTLLGPLASEVNLVAKSLTAARAAAEQEARLRHKAQATWTPEKLKEHVRHLLGNRNLFVISNREPYMHVRRKREIDCIVPASGLVTALEPVLRACGGVWIAHGSGDADREASDRDGKVRVPPEEPAYTLKRVWLSKDEVRGHYDGFSNEGLWPLCHITHTRPIFRLEDWEAYRKVNAKFARALLQEIAGEEEPWVLIQDYHFALLPAMIREQRPDARIALFWHIPWPNPESFGICPWKQEILSGMLGADVIGFHIQFHCNNFLDTVDNILESKINWESFSIERGGHTTFVRPFPISVGLFDELASVPQDRAAVRESVARKHGIRAPLLGVGVDRLDYTKGIVERFRAIERFLDKYPQFRGQFTFVELGAPSRENIAKYKDFAAEVEETAGQINARFQKGDWKPLVLLKGHHSHAEIMPFYQAADVCLVTSLHDGMNLVAKEFVASRSDDDGVLILSQFTGASRELVDALVVNPYDTEAVAEALRLALEMPQEERSARMRRMREVVRERNIYRWAATLLMAISQLPSQKASAPPAAVP